MFASAVRTRHPSTSSRLRRRPTLEALEGRHMPSTPYTLSLADPVVDGLLTPVPVGREDRTDVPAIVWRAAGTVGGAVLGYAGLGDPLGDALSGLPRPAVSASGERPTVSPSGEPAGIGVPGDPGDVWTVALSAGAAAPGGTLGTLSPGFSGGPDSDEVIPVIHDFEATRVAFVWTFDGYVTGDHNGVVEFGGPTALQGQTADIDPETGAFMLQLESCQDGTASAVTHTPMGVASETVYALVRN